MAYQLTIWPYCFSTPIVRDTFTNFSTAHRRWLCPLSRTSFIVTRMTAASPSIWVKSLIHCRARTAILIRVSNRACRRVIYCLRSVYAQSRYTLQIFIPSFPPPRIASRDATNALSTRLFYTYYYASRMASPSASRDLLSRSKDRFWCFYASDTFTSRRVPFWLQLQWAGLLSLLVTFTILKF